MKDKSKGSSLVKYGDFSQEEAEEDAKDIDNSKGSKTFVKLRPGKTTLRFLPPLPGKKWKRVTYVHYVDVPGAGRVNFVCPRLEAKQFCIVCKQEQKLLASGKKLDERKARKIRPKRRCFANVIDRAREEDGPKVLGFGTTIEEALTEMRKDEDIGGNFVDPVKGFDVCIIRKGTGENDTEYKVIGANKFKIVPLHKSTKTMNEWITSQRNLEKYAAVLNADEIEALLRGEKPDRDDDEEDDRKTRKRAKSSIDDEEDLVDTEGEEEEDDDEEEEDDEDEDDDD